jgi:Transposase DDE domain
MNKHLVDLYTSYLMASTQSITCTDLAAVLEDSYSHDTFTRFLSEKELRGSDLWGVVKPKLRELESLDNEEFKCLILDDHIEEKAYMQENDLIAWHYDHSQSHSIKGINQMSVLYDLGGYSLPVGFDFVLKTEKYTDKKTGKEKRRSPETKNEKYRKLIAQALQNDIQLDFVLNDVWFASAENMNFIQKDCQKDFVMPLKVNRKIAWTQEAQQKKEYQALSQLNIESGKCYTVYLQGVDCPLTLVKQVFKNKDESTGYVYLVCSREGLDFQAITTLYQRRWKVEQHHKSIKSILNYAKSPAHSPKTQQNHCVLCLFAFFEWECITKKLKTNHFALKAKIYLQALKTAWNQIVLLKSKIIIA